MKAEQRQSEEILYYMKYKMGCLVYLKNDKGRRIKTTFSKFYENYDKDKDFNDQDIIELIPIDPKYEAKMDKKELELALQKENNFDPYQMDLF